MQADDSAPFLRFDFPTPLEFGNPVGILTATEPGEVVPLLQAVERETNAGRYAAGFIAYEAASAFDPAFPVGPKTELPLAWFALFESAEPPMTEPCGEPATFSSWQPDTSRADYERTIDAIHRAIARGETYQANYTFRLRSRYFGDAYTLYERTASAYRSGYCAYLNIGRHRILSFSPELFFERAGDTITTRPMKGTMPRGRFSEEDRQRAVELATSEKDRAENVMITDLLRNDLGRIAEMGTVTVPDLFTVERYPTVWQMTSTVTAQLPASVGLLDTFRALFPCGSVTGAPKVQTMQLLSAWEGSPRRVYCGAIGYIRPGGDCVFNVAIRTLLLDSQTGVAEYGVGGGITWDSTPEGEYAEALTKARPVTEPRPRFALLETLRQENGIYTLRERHLDRLEDSARYFGFTVNRSRVESALQSLAESSGEGAYRVRLLVSQDGDIHLESAPLDALPPSPRPVQRATAPVDSQNPFLFHKTTYRAVYEAHQPSRAGIFDVLLWNERGELTEFTRGNLVVQKSGRFLTPPITAGLLAGTLRSELLETGKIEEQTLRVADLSTADALYFINSVRGWVQVTLLDASP